MHSNDRDAAAEQLTEGAALRLIDANALVRMLEGGIAFCMKQDDGHNGVGHQREIANLLATIAYIDTAPTVDAEVVRRGKWIDDNVCGMPMQACSACRTFYPLAYTGGGHRYCPTCGAKMEV